MKRDFWCSFKVVLWIGLILEIFLLPKWAQAEEKLSWGGEIRVGAVWDSQKDQSAFAVPTAELDLDAQLNSYSTASIVFLYEGTPFEGSDFGIDEAVLKFEKENKFMECGFMYVPFGAYLTHFPDDPLVDIPVTLYFGETQVPAMLVGWEKEGLGLSAYIANLDGENISDGGVDLHFSKEKGPYPFLIGISVISTLPKALKEIELDNAPLEEKLEEDAPAVALYSELEYRNFFLLGEYMATLGNIKISLKGTGTEITPMVWNIETGIKGTLWHKKMEIAFKWAGGNSDAETINFPSSRYGVAIKAYIFPHITKNIAYYHEEDRDVLVGQLTADF